MARRRNRALVKARKAGATAMLVTAAEDVRYLTRFSGEDSYLLLSGKGAVLVTDGRYAEQASKQCPELAVHVRKGRMSLAVASLLHHVPDGPLGLQSHHATLGLAKVLGEALPKRRICEVQALTTESRACKTAHETRLIVKAIGVAQQAMRKLTSKGSAGLIGRSERDIAAELDYLMCLSGAQCPSFATIVAAGAHASLPHYQPGSTKVRSGQCLLIDWGAKVDGYCSDLTRTWFIDTIPAELESVYKVVLRAQRAGLDACRVGAKGSTPDRAARAVIAQAGLADKFVHSLGHGIGLEVHEGPLLAAKAAGRLRSGMVVTVEPGVYLPGIGGVRIEDDILVGPSGPRRLSSLARSLRAVVLT